MITGRFKNREKAAFLAGIGAVLVVLTVLGVNAAGAAGEPAIEAYGGDVDVHGNDIQNLGELPGFFDTECTGSQVVSQVFNNGSYKCSDVSNTLSEVLSSDNSAGSNNLDMNGNNISGVDYLNPDGTWLNLDTNLTLSTDGDSMSSGDVHNAGVIYAQAISGADAPTFNFQVSSENDLRLVADRNADEGDSYIWTIHDSDGSLVTGGAINMSGGVLRMKSNDIVDGSTTIWDAANSHVPSGQVQDDWVDETGDTMSGDLDLGGSNLKDTGIVFANTLQTTGSSDQFLNADNSILFRTDKDGDNGGAYDWAFRESDGALDAKGNYIDDVANVTGQTSNSQSMYLDFNSPALRNNDGNQMLEIESAQDVRLVADAGGSDYRCWVDDTDGSWDCDGTKNWVHALNATHEAVYTSQESPEVRAVVEDTVAVEEGETVVALPDHFTGTVGSAEDMTVQVTPHELATVAAVERNRTHVTIAADQPVTVDYRVTGIREGYEDKQVIRQQDE